MKTGIEKLHRVQTLVARGFSRFGVNKNREFTRLIYEISKRESISPEEVINEIETKEAPYAHLKAKLLKKRFPDSYSQSVDFRPYLPELELSKNDVAKIDKEFYPKNIYFEEGTESSHAYINFKNKYPSAKFIRIESLKNYMNNRGAFSARDYNKRKENIFLVKQKSDYFKKCPCTKGAVSCGYHVFNLGFGCIFDCTYCFLQKYTNISGIILPVNLDDYFDGFNRYKKDGMRIGTGEFSDSLMLDEITGCSLPIIEFFNKNKNIRFEFKTKSKNISNLLKAKHNGNIVVSWSVNPQEIINENEFLTASLKERLTAASKCAQAGYKIGFHFDPIIYFKGWEKEYSKVVEMIFQKIKDADIAWISLGTLRFNPCTKTIIEKRFPDNKILDEELILGFDNKLRYYPQLRAGIYENMLKKIRGHSKRAPVYLCMEEKSLICLNPGFSSISA